MIRFPDLDPTGFCNSESDPGWTGSQSDMDIQTALSTAVKCLIRVVFGHRLDWMKHLDRSTGLGSDRITQLFSLCVCLICFFCVAAGVLLFCRSSDSALDSAAHFWWWMKFETRGFQNTRPQELSASPFQ